MGLRGSPEDEIRDVAYHEAGHAVVGVVTGLAVRSVEIEPTTYSWQGRTHIDWPDKDTTAASPDLQVAIATTAMAGRLCELRVSNREVYLIEGASRDDFELARGAIADGPDRGKEEAERVLSEDGYWQAVVVVATELVSRHVIDRLQLDQLIRMPGRGSSD